MNKDQGATGLANRLTDEFKKLPETLAIAWGGSRANAVTDRFSDLDIYIYQKAEIDNQNQADIGGKFADKAEIANIFFESGDEFFDRETGLGVDLIYRAPEWIERELARVLKYHQPSIGYSTAIWHNVRACRILYDPT